MNHFCYVTLLSQIVALIHYYSRVRPDSTGNSSLENLSVITFYGYSHSHPVLRMTPIGMG